MSEGFKVIDRDNNPLFPSARFLVVSIIALGSVLIDVCLIYRHRHTAPAYVFAILSTPIGAQLVYQWFRVLRECTKLRELDSQSLVKDPADRNLLHSAARLSINGMIDLLFFSYGIAIFALLLVGLLLSRLDGLR